MFKAKNNLLREHKLFEHLPKLSENDSNSLLGCITADELLKCNKFKLGSSPGLDGLPGEFYKKFFYLFGEELANCFNFAFQSGELSSSQKLGVITLLCKNRNGTESLDNYRPISLLNYDVKLLAKVIDNRLQKVIAKLVGPHQYYGVKGRTLDSALRQLLDILQYVKSK